MKKHITEELPERKHHQVDAKGGAAPQEGEKGQAQTSEKKIRQAVYDIRYRARREDVDLRQAFSQYMQNSSLGQQERTAVRAKLFGKGEMKEQYQTDIEEIVSSSISNAMNKVFSPQVSNVEEVDIGEAYAKILNQTQERKYKVRVTDKNSKKSYVRYATREKISQLRANPYLEVEMTEYGEPYEGERKRGALTARAKAGRGLDPVGREDSRGDVDNDGVPASRDKNDQYLLKRRKAIQNSIATRKESLDPVGQEDSDPDNDGNPNDPNDKYIMKRRKAIGKAIKTRTEEFIGEVASDEGSKKEKTQIKPMKKGETNKITVFPPDSSKTTIRAHYENDSEIIFEKKLTPAEKRKKEQIVKKLKQKYGKTSKTYAIATSVAKRVAEEADCGCQDDNSKIKKNEGSIIDPREIPTKINLIKNKMRAMGIKCSYEPEGEQIDEISYSARAARAGEDIGKPGKAFAKIAKEAGQRYGSEESGKKVAGKVLASLRSDYQPSGTTISEREMDEPGEEDWRPDVQAHNRAVGYRGGYKPYRRGYRGPKPGTSGPGSQVKPAD